MEDMFRALCEQLQLAMETPRGMASCTLSVLTVINPLNDFSSTHCNNGLVNCRSYAHVSCRHLPHDLSDEDLTATFFARPEGGTGYIDYQSEKQICQPHTDLAAMPRHSYTQGGERNNTSLRRSF